MFQRKVKITRIKKEETVEMEDVVLIEQSIDIVLDSKPLVSIVCLSKDLKELAIGFLFSIGIPIIIRPIFYNQRLSDSFL